MSLQGITSITLTDSGDLYTTVPSITFSAPTTAKKPARLIAILNGGSLNQINIDSVEATMRMDLLLLLQLHLVLALRQLQLQQF